MSEQLAGSPAPDLGALRTAIAAHAVGPYLLTVTETDQPHIGEVSCSWQGDEILVPAPSSWPGSEQLGRLEVSLLWPPNEPGGYNLIVDGRARSAPNGLSITITRAVHYRSAATSGEPPGSDCIPIISR